MDKGVTIIIPCYNVEDKINRCIESIKNQTFREYHVLLIDDGSTDKTAEMIVTQIKGDNKFTYIYKNNGGQASARNLGLAKTKTEWVTFIDSDDYVRNEYLEKLMANIDNNDLVACAFERIYENKKTLNTVTEEELCLSKYPAVWGKLFKKSKIIENNISFPEGLWYEDLEFFTKYMITVKEFTVINQPLYYYIQNNNSTMHTYSNKIFDIYIIKENLKKFCNNRVEDTADIEYILIYHILIGTIFRASFLKNFKKRSIAEIVQVISTDFPNWYQNKHINNQMGFVYRTYLKCLNRGYYNVIYITLKIFGKFLYL
jgi:Glycosyltransferases involved in cell wall biogenesis